MAINTAHYNGGVLIFCGEYILLYCDDVEIKFEDPSCDPRLKGCKRGRIYLTSHRLIFNHCDCRDPLQSFTFPFFQLSNVGLEQPTFGCNYIKGKVKSQPHVRHLHNDAWTGCAAFKIYFRSGGAIDFGMALLQAAKMASQHANREPPPPYVPPIEPFCQAPHNMYMPPQGTFGMVLPTHVFPNYPPCNSVFMTQQPPPYPGLNTQPPTPYGPCPPPQLHINAPHIPVPCHQHCLAAGGEQTPGNAAAAAKAQEAAAPAYYDPNNPHLAYMPPQAAAFPNAQPPSYEEATKKTQ